MLRPARNDKPPENGERGQQESLGPLSAKLIAGGSLSGISAIKILRTRRSTTRAEKPSPYAPHYESRNLNNLPMTSHMREPSSEHDVTSC